MNRITGFDEFVSEKMGVLSAVVDQAKAIHDVIRAERSRFLFHFELMSGGKTCPIRVKVDSNFKMGGQFNYDDSPPTVVVRDRDNFEVLVHELKHADRYFRMGEGAYKEDYTVLWGISDLVRSNSILPYRYRNLLFLFYFLQKEEFEAYFHSDWVKFSEIVGREKPTTKEEVMDLWRASTKTLAWQVYTGNLPQGRLVGGSTGMLKMKVPAQQRPFKFSNWCGDSVVDSVIWAYMRHKRDITVEDNFLMKVIKAITPESVLSGIDVNRSPPAKYADAVARARAKLESQIERTMEMYTRKYARIPSMAVLSIGKKD